MLENKKITIGIPAHNEEASIKRTLESVLKTKIPEGYARKIIVCAHNCSDKTSSIVRGLSKNHPELQLIELRKGAPTGKFDALNAIRQTADSDIVLFFDADVIVHRNAVKHILKDFEENSHVLAVSGVSISSQDFVKQPVRSPANLVTALMKKRNRVPTLAGRIYAIRNKRVPPFPPIIMDDLFMSAWVGKNRLLVDNRAKVVCRRPQTLQDYFKRQISVFKGEKEVFDYADKCPKNINGTSSAGVSEYKQYLSEITRSFDVTPDFLKKRLSPGELAIMPVWDGLRRTAKIKSKMKNAPAWFSTSSAKLGKTRKNKG